MLIVSGPKKAPPEAITVTDCHAAFYLRAANSKLIPRTINPATVSGRFNTPFMGLGVEGVINGTGLRSGRQSELRAAQ
jgi:hypothetical protein